MYIIRQLTHEPIFMADVNLVDKKDKIVRLIDDGAGSINLAANPKDVKLSYQPRIEAKASGICTGLICKPGKITLARLARVKGKYLMQIARGEAFEGKKEWLQECGYPMWPHAFINFKGDIDAFIQNLRSEYIHMTYGDLKDQLVEVCRVLGIEPVVS
jgi:L-fucose isomerase